MQKRVLFYALGCLISFNVLGQYTYEANQPLYDKSINISAKYPQFSDFFNKLI